MFEKPPKQSKAIPVVSPSSQHVKSVQPSNHAKVPNDARLQRAILEAAAGVASLNVRRPPNEFFNIYARPFVPQAYLDINQQPGAAFMTIDPRKTIDFTAYAQQSFGPAMLCLPAPSRLFPPRSFSPTEMPSLCPQNYMQHFHHHLNCEAEAQHRDAETYYLYGHELTLLPSPTNPQAGEVLYSLHVPGLRENTPLVEEEDVIELRQLRYECNELRGWTHIIYHARIVNIIRATETIVLRVRGLPGPGKFNVKFHIQDEKHLPMFLAIQTTYDAVSADGWLHSMLFPSNHDCEIQEQLHPGVFNQEFYDKQLNWEQKKAVEGIWSRSHGTLPYLISGPPGTGKTKTIIETALQLTQRSADCQHILLCAPSDPAADTLCQRLTGHLGPDEMLRLNRPYRTFAEVPGALLPYCCIENEKFALPPFATLMRYHVVVTTCRDADLLTSARMTNRDLFAIEQHFRMLTQAIHPFQSLSKTKLHWSAVLIDEAAQAMEPEALIPINVVTPPNDDFYGSAPLIVMAGDEYQLGPKIFLASSPLRESLFGRLAKRPVYAEHPLARGKRGRAPPPLTRSLLPILRPAFTNLIRNYRSHPAILAVPSHLFYWDSLEPEAKDIERLTGWDAWRGRGWPVLFHDNASPDELELPGLMQGNGGWYNRGEADIACSYAKSLVNTGRVHPQEVCIMSPFKAQVRHLRQCMRDARYGSLWDVNIGPTEAFQGLESGVVILCVTRTNKKFVEQDQKLGWGVIGTPNKMNVALTRAKFGLVVIGSRELLIEDSHWKTFLDFCDRNGLTTTRSQHSNGENGSHTTYAGLLRAQTTRLESVLIDKETRLKEPSGPAWGMLHGADQGHEMGGREMIDNPFSAEEEDTEDEHGDGDSVSPQNIEFEKRERKTEDAQRDIGHVVAEDRRK